MPPKFEVKTKERIRKGLERYIDIISHASQRGITEEDTSTIVQSMLVDLLGYDRFKELTGQYLVKGRWADWAVKVDDSLNFFVEVKPLSIKLREKDLFQVVSYSRQHDLEWAILSTADVWQCHRVASGQDTESFFEIRILDESQPMDEKVERFYLLSKEGFSRGAMQDMWIQRECFRPDRLAISILSDEVMTALRKIVHKDNPGRRVELDALRDAVKRGVIRGDLNTGNVILDNPPLVRKSRSRNKDSDEPKIDA
jgi:hypothetical protein